MTLFGLQVIRRFCLALRARPHCNTVATLGKIGVKWNFGKMNAVHSQRARRAAMNMM